MSSQDSANMETNRTFTGIITGVGMWLPCGNCENETRHVITNHNKCDEEKPIYRCCICSEDFVITEEFYKLICGSKKLQ